MVFGIVNGMDIISINIYIYIYIYIYSIQINFELGISQV
jgi:hypothetical protein